MTHTAKHTPGPWTVRTANNLTCICTPKGEMQVSLRDTGAGLRPLEVSIQEWRANAHLMAGAAAMYEALKYVAQFYQDNFELMPVAFQTVDNIVEQALAQADGE